MCNLVIRVFVHKQSYYMTANKSGSAGNDYISHIVIVFIFSKVGQGYQAIEPLSYERP